MNALRHVCTLFIITIYINYNDRLNENNIKDYDRRDEIRKKYKLPDLKSNGFYYDDDERRDNDKLINDKFNEDTELKNLKNQRDLLLKNCNREVEDIENKYNIK
jgi:hypothetical protein